MFTDEMKETSFPPPCGLGAAQQRLARPSAPTPLDWALSSGLLTPLHPHGLTLGSAPLHSLSPTPLGWSHPHIRAVPGARLLERQL